MYPIVTTGNRDVLRAFFVESKRLGLVVCAGGIRNSFLAGAHIYCREVRAYLREPVACIGVSSGYATRAYYQGGGKATDVRVFADDMSTDGGKLFKLMRKHPFDVEYVDAVFRHGVTGRPINAPRVLEHPTKLHGVLADPQTGKGRAYLPVNAHEVWELAKTTTAVTGFSKPMHFRGRRVTDGYASDLHSAVAELIRLHPEVTDVLVFASQHYEPSPRLASVAEMLLYRIGIAKASHTMQDLIQSRHIRFMAEANRIVGHGALGARRVCIVWLPKPYHPIYVSRDESRNLIKMGYHTMRELLKEAKVS